MSTWYKQGVFGELTQEAAEGLRKLEKVFKHVEDIYVTSVREGTHGIGSLHPSGRAFDIRHPKEISIHEIRSALGKDWDVIEEPSHLHLEFDPKD